MEATAQRAIAIVGVGAILPDAPDVPTFWSNVKQGRYSITDVTPDRWDPALYYDADPAAPEKTYSKIGGWVREWEWDPIRWKLPVPPRVGDAMDDGQKWGVACTRQALLDYGWPGRALDLDRTAVILGNAMAGEKHYQTALRILFPELARALGDAPTFAALPAASRAAALDEAKKALGARLPEITEDSMPGELANCIAGRVANLFNLHGPNFVVDAACASAMAAMAAAVEGLLEGDYDAVVTGGIDRNMGVNAYVKFCKIGALSPTGTRPYADGADGFVMGEGAAVFLMKRLADAERAGDRIYAVLRGLGGASDGKGKGITAPNPVGQKLAVERAWTNAGLSPATASLFEGHGTSTRVGDVVEVESLAEVLGAHATNGRRIPLGSVKSNIGHLKGAAGAAGILKAVLALHDKVLPPSLHFDRPNPNIDFARMPLEVNTALRDWPAPECGVRRAGVSAFGFGGTNFHVVLEEFVPGRLRVDERPRLVQGADLAPSAAPRELRAPLRGALVLGAPTVAGLSARLDAALAAAQRGEAPPVRPPAARDLAANERLVLDYGDAKELADRATKAKKALAANDPALWKMLRAQGIFRGTGPATKVAFLYTGQGSQYVAMLAKLRAVEPIVAETFAEADRVMAPLLDKPLTEYLYPASGDPAALAQAEDDLRQTAITQPAVLATDIALTRLFASYGIVPDMVMGHSLGEYGALVAAGALRFADALEAVSARGREMTKVSVADNGKMAAVFAPIREVERILRVVDGYVVIANVNSHTQAVIGGSSAGVDEAMEHFRNSGYNAVPLPVSHAFHTEIVAPASGPLRDVLARLGVRSPRVPVVANVTGEFYPMGPGVETAMLDILAKQVASPVQFVKGLESLHGAGARVYVEVGPKRALQGFVDDVLGERGVASLFTNHPKTDDVVAFNQALCGLYAAGVGVGEEEAVAARTAGGAREEAFTAPPAAPSPAAPVPAPLAPRSVVAAGPPVAAGDDARNLQLGRMFASFLEQAGRLYAGDGASSHEPVVITGAALGLPGTPRVFDDGNLARLLHGQQLIDVIPSRFRRAILDKHVTRLVKSEESGAAFVRIEDPNDVLKLAARAGELDLEHEYGVAAERIAALDSTTKLAIAAGLDALRDAGIPLVQHYRTTHKGTQLPERWGLADALRDDTGVIFASAFPGYDAFAADLAAYHEDRARRERVQLLEGLAARADGVTGVLQQEILRQLVEARAELERSPYTFERQFLFRILSLGHSQLAELIGARGPNTQVNSACASTTQAVSLAEDWIRAGRCRRVVIVAADDATGEHLMEWLGAGFLASGAAATDDVVEEAALPFDRRRHGMILGMGAAALVVESAEAARERGIAPICEVLATATANSAFHGTRLDVEHIRQVMEGVVARAETTGGVGRAQMAPQLLFVSHETYTPARGGSAAAEVHALRSVFGTGADGIVVANTKGFTGHPMGAGIEDVIAVKSLETGIVPPVANFKEVDPELGPLNLSRGGAYPVQYALRLGAGFGSQISMSLLRWTPPPDGARRAPDALGFAYRVADPAAWQGWLVRTTGRPAPELEVVHRTLRVKEGGAARVAPVAAPAATPAPAPAAATASAPSVVPAAAAPAVVPTVPVAVAAPAVDPVQVRVLEIVAEKTGYPRDMLELDLDLEADLGIDTVKQAETFAAVRGAWDIPRDDKLKLRDFPTLAHVVQFVRDRRPDLAIAVPAVVPAAAVATATVGATAAVASAPAADPVQAKVLEIVAEKTGYPRDMLELDLDLEADLGIDTVKQAETFAAVRGAWDIPRDEKLKLRDFPTLAHVVQFVRDRRPDLAATAPVAAAAPAAAPPATVAPVAAAAAAPAASDDPGGVQAKVLEIVAEKTGYPRDMLELDLDLEADLGVDTVKQAETFAAVRGAYDIPREEKLKLRDFPTLAHVVRFVLDRRPDLAAPAVVPTPAPAAAPPAAAPAAAPAEAAAADVSPREAEVRAKVLEIVAEKTGYPRDMLELDLDLEADLGVDTVKQAETFAAVRGAYGIARDDKLKLRDFPTLAHVVGFVLDRLPREDAPAVAGGASSAAEVASDSMPDAHSGAFVRRVPVPLLRPSLDDCKATQVALREGDRVLVAADRGGVAKALMKRLAKRGVTCLAVEDAPDAATLAERVAGFKEAGPVRGVYWLPALDPEGVPADLAAWRDALRVRVKLLYATMRALGEDFTGPGTFLVTATRLGGRHGYDAAGPPSPMGGAVTGFAKAFARERAGTLVKAVDFAAPEKPAAIADRLIAETLCDPGAVEVGEAQGLRWAIGLDEVPAPDDGGGVALDRETVFVVTGAAGGIVAEIVADLARASRGTFHLLDLAAAPDPGDPDVERSASDRDGLKRDLFERMKARGERATPAAVERELARLERARCARRAMRAVEEVGGRVHWHAVDLRDGDAVRAVIDAVLAASGRVDVLVHAAGIEISRFLPQKEPAEFDLVVDVKCDGWFNLTSALRGRPLKAVAVFSSIAGRFGNGGQTDYSAANDLLCKSVASLRGTQPGTRGIAIDWTAWADIGMASRGSIPKMMELAGIDMLPPSIGIPALRRELTSSAAGGEVVVAGRLGILEAALDESGGLDPARLDCAAGGPLLGHAVTLDLRRGLIVECTLDPRTEPFLDHHRIDGTAVLPGVMGIEAFAEAARLLAPGLHVAAIEDVRFLAPFKFYRDEPRTIRVVARHRADGDGVCVDCALEGERRLAGKAEPQVTTHFTATVRLGRAKPAAERVALPKLAGDATIGRDEVYRHFFHGPAYQVLSRAWQDDAAVVGEMARDLPAQLAAGRAELVARPRLVELCFQTAAIADMRAGRGMALPNAVGTLTLAPGAEGAKGPLLAVVTRAAEGDAVDAVVADSGGNVLVRLAGYRTILVPGMAGDSAESAASAAVGS